MSLTHRLDLFVTRLVTPHPTPGAQRLVSCLGFSFSLLPYHYSLYHTYIESFILYLLSFVVSLLLRMPKGIRKACANCIKARLACDEGRPCQRCVVHQCECVAVPRKPRVKKQKLDLEPPVPVVENKPTSIFLFF